MKIAHADAFVDSIGVNDHGTYSGQSSERANVIAALQDLGVRHIRDASFTWGVDQAKALSAAGFRLTYNAAVNGDLSDATLATQISRLRSLGGVAGVEGPNERDLFTGSWVADLKAITPKVYQSVKDARLGLVGTFVLGPSLAFTDRCSQLGRIDTAIDYGNVHSYPGGRPPESNIAAVISQAAATYGTHSLIATETGYHNALAQPNHDHPAVPEDVAGIYIPRLVTEYFRRGIIRTFLYQLVDGYTDTTNDHQENHFGLVRRDWTRKPAFLALRYLLRLFADPGQPLRFPDDPAVTVAGTDVLSFAARKRSGSTLVALWRPTSVWDTATYTAASPSLFAPVTVTLPANTTVRFHEPSRQRVTDLAPATSLTVPVADELVVLETSAA